MKICLLKCGSVFKSLQYINGDYQHMFGKVFNNNSVRVKFEVYEVYKDQYPEKLTEYDAFLSSGSYSGVYEDDPWIRKYRDFIKKLYDEKYKHIGICFGHQMIAQALGGHVEKAKQGWGLGIKKAVIKHYLPWMSPLPVDGINLIFSHQDQVVELPPHAKVLASNDHCPISMFIVDQHFLGIQAHPEFTREFSRAGIEYRRDIVNPEIIENALESLYRGTDEKLIIRWIENFIRQNL